MAKKISILGSTGSIGTQTLDVVRSQADSFIVTALAAGNNIELLIEQINEFKPQVVSVALESQAANLKKHPHLTFKNFDLVSGNSGLIACATHTCADIVVVAVVGFTGLIPTLEAIKAGKNIALANKETLVAGGSLVMPLAKKHGITITPVDSEHSAILQCIASNNSRDIKKILITASGGPFRTWEGKDIKNASIEQALKHPNWSMGKKVTIDSATLMNKALEIIEARWLFDVDYDNIDVLIHPQSIVHSMVEFKDNSVIAQLGMPSMHLPIQYALTYPERLNTDLIQPLNLKDICQLEFFEPDTKKFPCLTLAYKAGKAGGTMPAVLNAANEIAVNAFIDGNIKFYDIYNLVNNCLEAHQPIETPELKQILEADKWARKSVKEAINTSFACS